MAKIIYTQKEFMAGFRVGAIALKTAGVKKLNKDLSESSSFSEILPKLLIDENVSILENGDIQVFFDDKKVIQTLEVIEEYIVPIVDMVIGIFKIYSSLGGILKVMEKRINAIHKKD